MQKPTKAWLEMQDLVVTVLSWAWYLLSLYLQSPTILTWPLESTGLGDGRGAWLSLCLLPTPNL